MDKRDIEFIAETEWKSYLKRRKDPKNKKGYDFDDKLYSDLNQLGYNIQWGFNLQPTVFNGDERIFSIVKKYVSILEKSNYDREYMGTVSLLVHCLAHKKATYATEWLIEKYKEAVKKDVFFVLVNSYAGTIATIRDRRYVNEYIGLCQGEYLCSYSSYFVELLGKLKVTEAEDLLISLIDYRAKPQFQKNDEFFYSLGSDIWVSICAVEALGRIKSKKALPLIEKCLNIENLYDYKNKTDKTLMRNTAKKAIERINK